MIGLVVAGGVASVVADDDGPMVEHLDNGMPVAAGSIRGPGTAIDSGFEVAEGSWLLGGVVPFEYPDGPRGWQALIAIEGSGRAAFDDYVQQAEALGLAMGSARGSGCTLRDGELICAASGAGGDDDDLSVAIELHQAPAADPVPPQSTLTIQVHHWDRGAAVPAPDRRVISPQAPGDEADVPTTWQPLPEPGDPFWTQRNEIRGGPEDFRVPRGARILAHSAVLDGLGVSWTLFEVAGDVEDVMRELQAEDDGDRCPIEPTERDGVRLWWSCWTGSGSHVMWAVERPGEPPLLLLEANPLT